MKRDIFLYGSDKILLPFNKWSLSAYSDDCYLCFWISLLKCESIYVKNKTYKA